ncbi:MAG TPA: hypothetical protein DCE47_21650 [Planctomycetaceae bacterium]|nr:hypothetical protein [Planctomycetaceae bacterium]HCD03668.1 hypothetical protein [Planctomycetaceae bacterium]
MSRHFRPLVWSIPIGTWSGIRVSVSVWFLLAVAVLCGQLEGWSLGLLATMVLFISVLLHEIARVWVARVTGGWGDEILAWPLGGLAFVQPAMTTRGQVLAALAGPGVHALVCVVTGAAVWRAGLMPAALVPFSGWPTMTLAGGAGLAQAVILMLFTVNWALLLINLLPVHPFDVGRLLEWTLSDYLSKETAADLFLRLGALVGVGLVATGMLVDQPGWHGTWVVGLGAVILVLNLDEIASRRAVDELETALLDYELSLDEVVENYASIESEDGVGEPWGHQQNEMRLAEEQEEERQREVEQRVDVLLKKVHRCGFDALNDDEKRQLRQASHQYRDRATRPGETV